MNINGIIAFAFVLTILALVVGLSGCERIASMVPDAEMAPMMGEEVRPSVLSYP